MRILKRLLIIKAWALLALVLMSGCSQGTNTSSATCATGYVYSSTYGCVLSGSTYVYGTSTTTTSGCISISQTIPFYGSGLSIDYYGDLLGGTIPSYLSYGTMTVGSSTSAGGTTYSSSSSNYGSGTLSISVSGSSSSYYYSSGTATASGTLSISSSYQQVIQSFVTSSGLGSSTYGTSACVSGIAITGRLYSTGVFSGNVYLYLNGTPHGYVLGF
jgi:hypothetical protein